MRYAVLVLALTLGLNACSLLPTKKASERRCRAWASIEAEIGQTTFECGKESPDGWRCQRSKAHRYWASDREREHHSHTLEGSCDRWN